MDNTKYRKTSFIMLDLIAYAIGTKDDLDIQYDTDTLEELYKVAEKNGLTALTAYALKKNGCTNEKFELAYAMAQRKYILFNREYLLLSEGFNKADINYLPLKGILVKKIYPFPYLREMVDMDILFDCSPDKVRSVMLQLGYVCTQYDKANHDVYQKAPFFCVEMHRSLVDGSLFPDLYQYFSKMTYAFIDDNSSCMQMTKEQMYLHLIAHAYVHDTLAGTGLRTLLDINLYLKAYSDQMNMEYILKETASMGLSEYEASLRELSEMLLSYDKMTPEEKELLDNYIFAGKYGNHSRYIHNRIDRVMKRNGKESKAGYIRKRLSYNQRNIENSPFYSKHPKLSPLLYITRPINAVFTRPKYIIEEIKQLKKR